jgi:hypothetical protein
VVGINASVNTDYECQEWHAADIPDTLAQKLIVLLKRGSEPAKIVVGT